jgi:uncharacterized membrane protein
MASLVVLFILIVIVYVAAPIVAIVLAVRARNRADELAHRLTRLTDRLTGIENQLRSTRGLAALPAPSVEPTLPWPTEYQTPTSQPPSIAEPVPAATSASIPPVTSVPPVTPASAATVTKSFEENFGTRWAVWIGGIALVLGGYFLVRYSIEQGLLGPGVRIFLGALLAAALITLGESTRRQEKLFFNFAPIPAANIPSVLTAAGTSVAFATTYAAYALYGFLGASSAFVLLGIIALATLAAALLHGPALAGLGFVGAEITPLLVTSDQPNYWSLYIYLAIVTAATFALARIRMWRWLAITGAVFGLFWMIPGISGSTAAHVLHALSGFAIAAVVVVSGFLLGPRVDVGRIDGTSSGVLIAYVLGSACLVIASGHDGLALAGFTGLTVATVGVAWRTESAAPAVLAAAALAALVIADWALDTHIAQLVAPPGPTTGAITEPARTDAGTHLALGAFLAALFGIPGFLIQGRSSRAIAPVLWATSSVLAPLAILIALYHRIAGFERSIPFSGFALFIAAYFSLATETLIQRSPRPGLAVTAAIYASGAVAALALALTLALDKGWLTVGLALMVPGIAWVANRRPLQFLRVLAAAIVVVVIARVGYEPRIVGTDVGTTPIFNWLLYGYGVPALSFWYAGYTLRQRADDIPSRIVEAAAILLTVLLAFLEIRHFTNEGDVYRQAAGLDELDLQVWAGLAMTIGLEWVRGRTRNVVHNVGALVVAGLTLLGIAFGLCLIDNPMITGDSVGSIFDNLILLGYGVPAVLVVMLLFVTRTTRPLPYRVAATVVAVVLGLLYLSLEVARVFQGPSLGLGHISDAERYTYSAIWLAYGAALLGTGIVMRLTLARLASAAIVLLTVGKVFLVDMNALAGPWRALSFIGLGLVLVGIGLLYQRLLFPARA